MLSVFVTDLACDIAEHARFGIMIKEYDDDSLGGRYALLYVGGDNEVGFLTFDGSELGQNNYKISTAFQDKRIGYSFKQGELRLRKIGQTVTAYARKEYQNEWTLVHSIKIDYINFYLGIAMTSHPLGTCGQGRERGDGVCGNPIGGFGAGTGIRECCSVVRFG